MLRLINKSKLISWIGPWKGAALVTLFFVMLASFLFWLDFFRAYETEMRILVINREIQAPKDIAINLAEISETLAFYERLLVYTEEVQDPFTGLSPDQRKQAWRSKVEVQQVGESDTLLLLARDTSLEASRKWARESTETLFGVAAFYYDIRRNTDLRIIDGPLSRRVVVRPVEYILVSLTSALGLTAVFFLLLRMMPALFAALQKFMQKDRMRSHEEKKEAEETSGYPIGENVPFIDPKKFLPTRPRSLHFDESAEKNGRDFPAPSQFSARAAAPLNLPLAPPEEEAGENTFYPAENAPDNLPFADADFTHAPESHGRQPVDEWHQELSARGSAPTEVTTGATTVKPWGSTFSGRKEGTLATEEESRLPAGPPVPRSAEPTAQEYKARLNKLLANGNE